MVKTVLTKVLITTLKTTFTAGVPGKKTLAGTALTNNTPAKKISLPAAVATALCLPSTAQAEGDFFIEELVVTAQRREQSIQDIPIAATAFSRESLKEQGITDPQDLSKLTPNVDIWSSFGESAPKVTIRGIGSSSFNQNTESTAVIYLDEFPLNPTPAKLPQLFDLERVEVLRGPQGTLYGKNTTGGAINVITRRPSGETGGHVNFTAGRYGQLDTDAAAETAFNEQWSIRVAARSQDRDGYGRNLATGDDIYDKESLAARVGLLYQSTDTSAYFKAWWHRSRADGFYTKTQQTDFAGNPQPANPITGAVSEGGGDPYRGAWNEQQNDVDNWGVNANIDYDWGAYTLSLVTGYLASESENFHDCDGTDVELCRVAPFFTEAQQFSTELRITSNFDGNLNYMLGLNYFAEDLDIDNFYSLALATLTARQSGDQQVESVALFFDGTYQITAAVQLLGGIRWTRDDKEFFFQGTDGATFSDTFVIDDDESWSEFTYRAGLNWLAGDDRSFYFTYSRGYRAGAYDTGLTTQPEAQGVPTDPEFVNNYELGLKSFWLDRRLQLNAALFFMEFEDQQLLVVKPGFLCCTQENAGESEITGIELEGRLLLSPALSVNYAATWLDAEYTRWVREGRDLSGQALANAPEYQLTLSPEYTVGLWGGEAFAAVDYTRVGETRAGNDFDVLERDIQAAYNRVDARIGYRGDAFSLILWGRNLGNKAVLRDWLDLSSFGFVQELYGEPRSYGITASYDF